MMWWLINLAGFALSWLCADLDSSSVFRSSVCPILIPVFFVALMAKLVAVVDEGDYRATHRYGGSGYAGREADRSNSGTGGDGGVEPYPSGDDVIGGL